MLSAIRRLVRREPDAPPPAIPAGQRVYAVGDIHGRLDLFEDLIVAIEADDTARGAAQTTVVLLGDLVDRGPDSAGVIERAMDWVSRRTVRIIMGNHEEMFLEAFDSKDILRHFLIHGGRETLLSYPITREDYDATTLDELRAMMPQFVDPRHRAFLEGLEDQVRIGDYLFVHAGIRPGVPLEDQRLSDLRWIRNEFLNDRRHHGFTVIHGHTITDTIDEQPNRIGIDTGAFQSGVLTAVGLEGTERWFLQTLAPDAETG